MLIEIFTSLMLIVTAFAVGTAVMMLMVTGFMALRGVVLNLAAWVEERIIARRGRTA